MTYDGNLHPGLGQAQKCDRVKPVNGILILAWMIIFIYVFGMGGQGKRDTTLYNQLPLPFITK